MLIFVVVEISVGAVNTNSVGMVVPLVTGVTRVLGELVASVERDKKVFVDLIAGLTRLRVEVGNA